MTDPIQDKIKLSPKYHNNNTNIFLSDKQCVDLDQEDSL